MYFINSLIFLVEYLQRQLKNLKDNLKKCLDKRQRMTRSGAAASSLPQCKYFHQMKFLHEKTANQPTESNISHQAQQVTVPPPADTCEPANQIPCNSATKRKASTGAGRTIIEGANNNIFVFTDCKNNRFQKKLIKQNALYEYSPPNYRSGGATEIQCSTLPAVVIRHAKMPLIWLF